MPEEKNMPTAAAYIRVSTDDQAELSPDSQLEEIKKYASREGLRLLQIGRASCRERVSA